MTEVLTRFGTSFDADGQHHISIPVSTAPNIGRLGKPHGELRRLQFSQCQGEHRFKHRDVDVLAFLTAVTLMQRRCDGSNA